MAGDVAQKELRARVGAMPWAVRLQLRALEAAVDATQRRDGTVNRFLFSLLVDRQAPANPERADAGGVCSVDVIVDASTGVRARVYFAAGAEADASPRPVIVYFHGGGFTVFSAATHPYDGLCRTMCRETGAVVVSVTYRLAPEHHYPAAYDDRNHPAAHVTGETGPEPELPEAFPPAMVVVGGLDPLQDWGRRYAAMLRRKGKEVRVVEFTEAIHAFYFFPVLPETGKLVAEIRAFVESIAPNPAA